MNTHCKHFCPFCKYYSRCVRDTIYELVLEDVRNSVNDYFHMNDEIQKWL